MQRWHVSSILHVCAHCVSPWPLHRCSDGKYTEQSEFNIQPLYVESSGQTHIHAHTRHTLPGADDANSLITLAWYNARVQIRRDRKRRGMENRERRGKRAEITVWGVVVASVSEIQTVLHACTHTHRGESETATNLRERHLWPYKVMSLREIDQ